MEHIITFSGEKFKPLEPDLSKIHIEDIAHSLSLMCRANGHIDHFYSIAQHSINCAIEAKARGHSAAIQLICLIHDASEAYISDITRPVKQYLHDYKKIEKHLQDIIYVKFLGSSISTDEHALMSAIDDDMLACEFDYLMSNKKVFADIPKLQSTPSFIYRPQIEVETEFLKLYYGILHAGIILGR